MPEHPLVYSPNETFRWCVRCWILEQFEAFLGQWFRIDSRGQMHYDTVRAHR